MAGSRIGRLMRMVRAVDELRSGLGDDARGSKNVPKEHAPDFDGRSHRCRPTSVTEATEPGAGTHDRNRVIRCRLPLRDGHSIGRYPDETLYQFSPNLSSAEQAVHRPSTMARAGAGGRENQFGLTQ